MSEPTATNGEDDHLYLIKVMAEIDEEVERRRNSGDMPARLEHELDQLFMRFSPMAGRDGTLDEALGLVESTSFIDPVVPLASSRSGGAVVKRTIRQASLWYMSWVTAQINQFTSATARMFRVLDDRMRSLQAQVDLQQLPPAPVLEIEWAHGSSAWWRSRVVEWLRGCPGRALHVAAGDGWLVRLLVAEGVDAYGVEPREGRIDRAEIEGVDVREEAVLEHLRSIGAESLSAIVLSGVVDVMTAAERDAAIRSAVRALGPEGQLVVHSLSQQGWASDLAPVDADLASGRPLRARSWIEFLARMGFAAQIVEGPSQLDYLVLATPTVRGEESGGAAT